MAEEVKPPRFSAIFAHPVIVVFVTAIVGSFLVPRISVRTSRATLIQEQRLRKALEILSHATQNTIELNRLITTLEIFHKDNSGAAAKLVDYRQEQRVLRKVMAERYLEFERNAWFWFPQARSEGVLLGIASPEEVKRFEQLDEDYDKLLIESTHALDTLWTTLLRETYRPDDVRIAELVGKTRSTFDDLSYRRLQRANELAQMMATK
jgi:hypothetical protein